MLKICVAHALVSAEPGARAASSDTVDDSGTARSKRKATSASRTPVDIDDSDDDRNASKKVKKEKKKPVTAGRVIDIDDDDEEVSICLVSLHFPRQPRSDCFYFRLRSRSFDGRMSS